MRMFPKMAFMSCASVLLVTGFIWADVVKMNGLDFTTSGGGGYTEVVLDTTGFPDGQFSVTKTNYKNKDDANFNNGFFELAMLMEPGKGNILNIVGGQGACVFCMQEYV